MQLFKTFTEAEEFLKNLETDLDRIDCLDYLILELEEKTLDSEAHDSISSSKDSSEALSSIEQWNSILPYLRRRRRDLLKIHSDDFNERLESSFPPGKRLSFPVPSSKEELMKTICVYYCFWCSHTMKASGMPTNEQVAGFNKKLEILVCWRFLEEC